MHPAPAHPAGCNFQLRGTYDAASGTMGQMRIAEISVWDSAGVKYTQGEFNAAQFGFSSNPDSQAQPISK